MTLWAVHTLIIAADRWVDVRDWARVKFRDGTEVIAVRKPYHPDLVPDVTLQWVGSDAGAHPNRRLTISYRTLDIAARINR